MTRPESWGCAVRRAMAIVSALTACWLVSSSMSGPVAVATSQLGPTAVTIAAGDRVAVLAGGAALAVPVTYSCPSRYAGPASSWSVEVSETLASGEVRDGMDPGGPGDYATCDGKTQHGEILVLPPLPYQAGRPATLSANLLACTPDGSDCVQPALHKTVQLQRASASDPANQPAPATARLVNASTLSLTVPERCPPGRRSGIVALVWQATATDLTEGTGNTTRKTCGSPSTTITVTSSSASLSFHRGPSYLYAYSQTCVGQNCTAGHVLRGLLDIR